MKNELALRRPQIRSAARLQESNGNRGAEGKGEPTSERTSHSRGQARPLERRIQFHKTAQLARLPCLWRKTFAWPDQSNGSMRSLDIHLAWAHFRAEAALKTSLPASSTRAALEPLHSASRLGGRPLRPLRPTLHPRPRGSLTGQAEVN